MEFPKGLKEGFLSNVFSLVSVTKEVGGGANQSGAVSGDQKSERSLITLPAPDKPLPFLGSRINRGHAGLRHIDW